MYAVLDASGNFQFTYSESVCFGNSAAKYDVILAELGQSSELSSLLPTLPPIPPHDTGRQRLSPFMACLIRLDRKLQKLLGGSSTQLQRRSNVVPASPFAQANEAFTPSSASSCTKSCSHHAHSRSCDSRSSSSSFSSNSSLHRAVTAPGGSIKHFLDRDFMATLQSQSRYCLDLASLNGGLESILVRSMIQDQIRGRHPSAAHSARRNSPILHCY